MGYRGFLALKYLKSREKRFFTFTTFISIIGIALGVCTIIVVMGVMSGFTEEVRNKILGLKSHLFIQRLGNISSPYPLMERIEKIDGVIASSPVVWGEGIIKYRGHARGVIIKGIDYSREIRVTDLKNYIKDQEITSLEGGILIGSELAKNLDLSISDEVFLISADLKGERFKVKEIFNSGIFHYDHSLIFLSTADTQRLLGMEGKYSGIQVKIKDIFRAPHIKKRLNEVLGPMYQIRTWQEMDRTFYYALRLERIAMFIIPTLIIIVASFNIASTLIMMVMEKRRQIGILRVIGSPSRDIKRIFFYQGLTIGGCGTILGCILGFLISFLLKEYLLIPLPEEIYGICSLPVKIEGSVFLLVSLLALSISILATIYPAYAASKLEIGQTLRCE